MCYCLLMRWKWPNARWAQYLRSPVLLRRATASCDRMDFPLKFPASTDSVWACDWLISLPRHWAHALSSPPSTEHTNRHTNTNVKQRGFCASRHKPAKAILLASEVTTFYVRGSLSNLSLGNLLVVNRLFKQRAFVRWPLVGGSQR